MKARASLWASMAIAASIGLAGCGGSSNNKQTETDTESAATTQMTDLKAKATTLDAAVAGLTGVDDDDRTPTADQIMTLQNAITALRTSIRNASAVDDTDEYAGKIETAQRAITVAQAARKAADDAESTTQVKNDRATGQKLYAALSGAGETGTNPLLNIATVASDGRIATGDGLQSAGLLIDAADGAGSIDTGTDPSEVTLEAGDSVGALGDWSGMDYSQTSGTGDAKLSNEARVYTNQGTPKQVAFDKADGITVADETSEDDDSIDGYVTLVIGGTRQAGIELSKIMADAFEHSGTQNHSYDPVDTSAFTTRGTYDGADGVYRCAGICTSTNDGKDDSPSTLAGTWHFKPDSGAMVSEPDANYLYFGWWVSKDSKGMPTAVSAFHGIVGDVDNVGDTDGTTTGGTALTGSATYNGHAAGKFAMNNELSDTGSGHFTADAKLEATFGGSGVEGAGIKGTINNFKLNDEPGDPKWSVDLHLAGWGADGLITAPTDVGATDDIDESLGTTWSIDGDKASASGTWSGAMYDDKPGLTTADPAGDGSDIPTVVTGTFHSNYGTIGRMVGAFGATR